MTTADVNPSPPTIAPDLSAAAIPDQRRALRLRIAVLVVAAGGVLVAAAVAGRAPDPLQGDRPAVADIAMIPRAQMAFEAFYTKQHRPPTPAELTKAIAKDRGPKVPIVGPGEKKPHALRLAGTPTAPALELLNELGEVAVYGDMPVVIQVRVP